MKAVSASLIFIGIAILALIFWPVAKEEVKYTFHQVLSTIVKAPNNIPQKSLTPPNTDFSIVIPKIGAAAPIFANIDPSNPKNYLSALKKGVAHAAGTDLPGETGNVYLFAHSTDAFWNVGTYNAVFYLIGKLNPGDEIVIYYNGKAIKYQVYDKKVVGPDSSQYFGTILPGEKTLTLQTCYPPGTTFERLVVLAKELGD